MITYFDNNNLLSNILWFFKIFLGCSVMSLKQKPKKNQVILVREDIIVTVLKGFGHIDYFQFNLGSISITCGWPYI